MIGAHHFKFERLTPAEIDFEALDQFEDRLFSQRKCWLDFLTSFVWGEPIVAALMRGPETVGYFTGMLFRRAGVKILASPFRGWTTPYMGFNLQPDIGRSTALAALERFAFRDLGCLHLEVADRYLELEEGSGYGFSQRIVHGYLSDLAQDDEALLKGMSSACRRAIRKSAKEGVTIVAGEPDGFAEQLHEHLCFVFAKQGLKQSYGPDRVQRLIDASYPSGNLLLLRAFEPGGQCIATGVYPGFRSYSFFWANGSHPDFLTLRPNEALHWHAMRYWRDQGVLHHDWGGSGAYKAKYGGTPFTTLAVWKSRYKAIRFARDMAEKLYYLPRNLMRNRYDARVEARRGERG
jgi:hypothetical protein